MAILISKATGNFTSAATWAVVDATSFQDTENTPATLSTSLTGSSSTAFAPGAITIDGIAVKVSGRPGATGTITVDLYNHTDLTPVTGATCTVNVADIPTLSSVSVYNRGWVFFKFAAPVTLVAGKSYYVRAATSSGTQITLYRTATASNWARMLRTTTTAAPAAGDVLHIIGELTGPGTSNAFTVTLDNTATTVFGNVTVGTYIQAITVGNKGTLNFGTTAATNYYFKWKGVLGIFDLGTVNIGSSGTPIPANSSAVLEMDSSVNVDTGIELFQGGTLNAYGNPRTNLWTFLTADKAISDTVLQVTSTAGWEVGDSLVIGSTSRTATDCEKRTILTVDSGTQVTLSAGLGAAHSGTGANAASVLNLTQNIKVRGISTSLQGYLSTVTQSFMFLRNVEFSQMGGPSSAATKRGLSLATNAAGTLEIRYCTFHAFTVAGAIGLDITGQTGSGHVFSNLGFYDIATYAASNPASSGVCTYENIVAIFCGVTTGTFQFLDAGHTYNNIKAIGSRLSTVTTSAISISEVSSTASGAFGNCSNLATQSCAGAGMVLTANGGTVANISVRRSGGYGLTISSTGLVLDTVDVIANNSAGILFSNGGGNTLLNVTADGDSLFPQNFGVRYSTTTNPPSINNIGDNFIEGGNFGMGTGHATADIGSPNQHLFIRAYYQGVNFGSPTLVEYTGTPNSVGNTLSIFSKVNGSAADNRVSGYEGVIQTDSALFRTSAPSVRMTPRTAARKLGFTRGFGLFRNVASGATANVSVYVRRSKTSTGDSANYNGALPRLIVRRNVSAGIAADTVLATATSASDGAWELLTGTTAAVSADCGLEFYIDCDGTTGWVNFDDFCGDGLGYWIDGTPLNLLVNASGGGETSHAFAA